MKQTDAIPITHKDTFSLGEDLVHYYQDITDPIAVYRNIHLCQFYMSFLFVRMIILMA